MMDEMKNIQITDRNELFDVAFIQVIGDRSSQEDSFGFKLYSNEGIIVVCDGMGGYEKGKESSELAVKNFINEYELQQPILNPISFLQETSLRANQKIFDLAGVDGRKVNCGTTLVAVYINGNALYWNSMGDSRAYLFRNGEMVQFTLDHNYSTVLNEQKKAGLITEERYKDEIKKGEVLISYLGMKDIGLIDYNNSPLYLEHKDRIIVMSDGLYKLLSDKEIKTVLLQEDDLNHALNSLEKIAANKSKIKQTKRDNMTVALIAIR